MKKITYKRSHDSHGHHDDHPQATDKTNMGSRGPACSCQSYDCLCHWRLLRQTSSGHQIAIMIIILIIIVIVNRAYHPSPSVCLILIIQIQEAINEEAKQFGDILQVGIFIESDISLKTLNSADDFEDMFQSSFFGDHILKRAFMSGKLRGGLLCLGLQVDECLSLVSTFLPSGLKFCNQHDFCHQVFTGLDISVIRFKVL